MNTEEARRPNSRTLPFHPCASVATLFFSLPAARNQSRTETTRRYLPGPPRRRPNATCSRRASGESAALPAAWGPLAQAGSAQIGYFPRQDQNQAFLNPRSAPSNRKDPTPPSTSLRTGPFDVAQGGPFDVAQDMPAVKRNGVAAAGPTPQCRPENNARVNTRITQCSATADSPIAAFRNGLRSC